MGAPVAHPTWGQVLQDLTGQDHLAGLLLISFWDLQGHPTLAHLGHMAQGVPRCILECHPMVARPWVPMVHLPTDPQWGLTTDHPLWTEWTQSK